MRNHNVRTVTKRYRIRSIDLDLVFCILIGLLCIAMFIFGAAAVETLHAMERV
jgi:hypothetical protein